MKKYKLILFLSTAFLSVACTDSFFDLEPSSSVPTDKVYKTADDFNVAVMGCYSKLQTQVSYFTECCEYRSDNLTLSMELYSFPNSCTREYCGAEYVFICSFGCYV